jgi:MoCo/4Fe-4S cofactor protein with predicted Tat translocation signal
MSPLNNTSSSGKTYWRSLDELEGSSDFQEYLHREFPEGASELSDPTSRRGFMKVMAASFALAGGLTGCRRPEEKIMPYTQAPEDVVPGKAYYIATSAPRSRGSLGMLVKSNGGRPTKIEGLPGHPANDGCTDSMAQADLLDLYNPFRQKTIDIKGQKAISFEAETGVDDSFRKASRSAYSAFNKSLDALAKKYESNKGKGLSFLGSPVSSPTQLKVLAKVAEKFPQAKWHCWEAINDDNASAALKIFLGAKNYNNQTVYDITKAETILTLDSDFMMNERNSVKMLQDYGDSRRLYTDSEGVKDAFNLRFYAVESSFSLSGSNADHRLRLQSHKIIDFLFQLAKEVAVVTDSGVRSILESFSTKDTFGHLVKDVSGIDFVNKVAAELKSKKGKSAIIVGDGQPVEVHLLALVLNDALGNIGNSVKITEKAAPAVTFTDGELVSESIQLLGNDMKNGAVETLVILDGNPVYDAPADIKFAESLKNVKEKITLTLFPTETSKASDIIVPKSHYLESWGDTRAYDGTLSFVQPLIAPLYSSYTEIEFLSRLAGITTKGSKLVRETHGFADKAVWEKNLQQGYQKDSAFAPMTVKPNWSAISSRLSSVKPHSTDQFQVVFAPDYSTFDGRYSNNGWMHELPDPISKLVWDNAALISYSTAKKFKLEARDMVTVKTKTGLVTVPCWVVPGMADNTVQLTLGYGRKDLGEDSGDRAYQEFTNCGYDAYQLREIDAQWFNDCTFTKASGTGDLVTTQDHWAMESRELVKEANLDDLMDKKRFKDVIKHQIADHYDPRSKDKLYSDRKEYAASKYQWAMVIDLNSCVGCSACTIACQAENNIAVVGKERVSEGREMHWIRMDRYFFSGKDSELGTDYESHDLEVGALHQPIPCMQCEEAPCEEVCPVAATQHSEEGLNDMVYNRCIGTRYCLNNCPYKVRRFNYFNFAEDFKDKRFEVNKMVHNPGVTVRSRGVMEKCTYCVQRINEAKIDAKLAKDETIIDSFTTACAQVCPTKAITFGNQNSETTAVTKMQKEGRNYTLLPQLNLRPRTSFLGKINNPNAELTMTDKPKNEGH